MRTVRCWLAFSGICVSVDIKVNPEETGPHGLKQLKNRLEGNAVCVRQEVLEAPNEFQTK